MKTRVMLGSFRLLTALGLVAVLGAMSPRANAAPAVAVEEIFLTGAVEKEVQVQGRTEKRWMPDDTKLAFAWADRPFAIHVPFQMETEVRQLTQWAVPRPDDPRTPAVYAKDYVVRPHFRGFTHASGNERRAAQPAVLTTFLYRFDGQPVYADGTNRYFFLNRYQLSNLDERPNDKPYPQWLNGRPARAPGRVGFCLVVEPRDVSSRWNELRLTGGGISPGSWKLYGERASGTFFVSIGLGTNWGTEKQFEVLVRQNGWVLREPKVTASGDWNRIFNSAKPGEDPALYKNPHLAGIDEWRFQDLGTTVQGLTLTTKHRMVSGNYSERAKHKATDVEVVLQMPPRVYDHVWTNGTLDVRQTAGGAYPGSARYGLQGAAARFEAFQFVGPTNAEPKPVASWGYAFAVTMFELGKAQDPVTGLYRESWSVDFYPGQIGDASPERKSQNLLVATWPPEKRIDTHRPYVATINYYVGNSPQPLQKRIDFFAARLSEIEDNRVGRTTVDGPVTAERLPDDGFFTWQPEFRMQTGEMRDRIAKIKVELLAQAREKRRLRNQWRDLWRMDVRSFPKMDESGGLADSLFRFGKDVAYGGRKTIPLQPTLSKERLLGLQTERKELDVRIQKCRADQQKLLEEADQLVKALITSAQIQAPKTDEGRRKVVWNAVDYYQDYQRVLKVELMESGECFDAEPLQAAINNLKFNSAAKPELAPYMQGLYWEARAREYDERFHNLIVSPTPPPPGSEVEKMARSAWLEALMQYRKALDINPAYAQAKQKRAMIEVKFVQIIAGKVNAEQRLSLERFHSFLSNRGYRTEEATNWSQSICEAGSIFLFSLPSTLAHGLPEGFWTAVTPSSTPFLSAPTPSTQTTVGLLADTVDIEVTTASRNLVSLLGIRRLIEKGMKLEEIPQITPALYEKYVPLKAWSNERLPADRAERNCRDIRETFADLGDLRALLSRDRAQIEAMLDRCYFQSYTTEQSWPEFLANMFLNPISLLAAAPSATIQGGKTTVGALLTQSPRYAKLSAGLKASRFGAMVDDYAAAYNQLTYTGAGVNILAGGLAFAILSGGAAEIANQNDYPMLSLLIQALAALGAERLVWHMINDAGVPPNKLASAVEEMSAAVSRKEAELVDSGNVIKTLEEIQKRLAASPQKVLSEADRQELRGVFVKIAEMRGHIPGDNPEADLHMALAEALRRFDADDTEGAVRALEAARKAQGECMEQVAEMSQSITGAREALSKPPTPVPPLADYDPGPMKPIKAQIPSAPKEPPGGYPADKFGAALQAGDEAFKRGDFAAAALEYATALQWARDEKRNAMKNMLEPRLNRAQRAEQCSAHLQKVRKAVAKIPVARGASKATDVISPGQLAELQKRIEAGQITKRSRPGKSPLFEVTDAQGNRYILKIVETAATDMAAATAEIQDELGAAALANLVGSKLKDSQSMRAPGAAPVHLPNKKFRHVYPDGTEKDLPFVGIISRYVDHKEFLDLTEAEVLALRREFAMQRVFRLWIGDPDGHLRNHLRSVEGSGFAIDFGFAEFTAKRRNRLARDNKRQVMTYADDDEHLRNLLAFPAILRKHAPDAGLYHSIAAMDEFINFNDMSEAVDIIERLCKTDRAELDRIVTQFFGADRKEEVMKVLTDRGDGRLRDAIRRRFDPTHPDFKPTVMLPDTGVWGDFAVVIPPSAWPSALHRSASTGLTFAA